MAPIPIPIPIPIPTADELWGLHLMPSSLNVIVLMPNGLMLEVGCSRDSSLESIKTSLWIEARKNALYSVLNEQISYIFVAVTQDAKLEEFYDESRKLCDLRLFQPILKLIEPEGNREEKILSSEISLAIGRPIHEFDTIKLTEVIEFRKNILTFCRDIVEKRERLTIDQKVMYTYAPELDNPIFDDECDESISICCWTASNGNNKRSHLVNVRLSDTAIDVIYETLILLKHSNKNVDQQRYAHENKDRYFLKICGLQQYLLGSYPLCRYKYIRWCLSQTKKPHVLLVGKQEVYDTIQRCVFLQPSFLRRISKQTSSTSNQSSLTSTSNQSMPLWKAESMFRIKILLATYVNIKDVDKIYVKSGVYHGPESLCEEKRTKYVVPQNPKWNEYLEFDLYIPDIPRNARLCFSICAMNFRKRREEHFAIAWGNMQLFDFKNFLLSERININLWPMPKGFDELLNPLGMIGSNPNNDASCLQIEFDRFASPVLFPSDEQIEEYASFIHKHEIEKILPMFSTESQSSSRYQSDNNVTENELTQVNEILKRDPLYELSEQEKDLLWRLRCQLLKIPDSLPKLLDSVKWNNRDEVSQLYVLLKRWSKIKIETALELLDCKYADMTVREYSVRWLDQELTDDRLLQFLLQLVQVLKKEPYFDNELTYFLLRRALMNQRIGHFFFWFLKAEMHEPINSLRCGLILEAYCRAVSLSNLKALVKQVGALEKLERLTDILKERKDDTQKDRLRFLSNQIRQPDFFEALQNLPNPLNCSLILGNIIVEECRIMDSAKRPLWLVWSNPDPDAQYLSLTNSIIFKSGDDLRQDMLTLQVIRIINLIWCQSKLDLKMLPYTCLATGKLVGLIEVVRNSKTVMNIQRSGGLKSALQVDSSQLHKWIKENNKDNYDKAVENFTRSCAGYCVATFILGIGDRNPDNIMINEDGQIFHIDFGHFLGHFKRKFGINRERVPFVLTLDFLQVISKGSESPLKSKEFEEFKKLCGFAYLALHDNANLLITLFTMMLSTGIPELQSMEDISYLRQTLQVEKNSVEALKYFETQLDEAHGGAWSTKIDWFFHSVKHSSKT